jgi:hypothetical protein
MRPHADRIAARIRLGWANMNKATYQMKVAEPKTRNCVFLCFIMSHIPAAFWQMSSDFRLLATWQDCSALLIAILSPLTVWILSGATDVKRSIKHFSSTLFILSLQIQTHIRIHIYIYMIFLESLVSAEDYILNVL